ncbi:UNVERIFIED_CONTAM: hypothetical protein GTU68_003462 [Idotea baltica]|nr:hypothetical protein [Idotea baltica]
MSILTPYTLGSIELKNRLVMAPMTRSRATDNIPNDLMVTYYEQRASAGLIITEGTAPSPNGLGYPRIPGVYSDAQIAGWKKVTDAVHAKGGKIFLQIMHTGRVSHPANMEEGTRVVAPSAILASGEMYTDSQGSQPHPVPEEMNAADIAQAQEEYVQASRNAIAAGFDGVELHSANGYLMDQFLNPASNHRSDDYGGEIAKRNRFVLETAEKVVAAIGGDKTGIRLSPYGAFNDMGIHEEMDAQFTQLAEGLGKLGLVYLHLVDHSGMGTPEVPTSIKSAMRDAFAATVIIGGNVMDKGSAESAVASGLGELVYIGRSYISNPDLAERFAQGVALAAPNMDTLYTPGPEGYTDYPAAV